MTGVDDQNQEDGSTLLQLQTIKVANPRRRGSAICAVSMWDPGSTLSFITFGIAKELGVEGVPIELEICTVGGTITKVNSMKYSISLMDTNGQDVQIEVLGIETISTDVEAIDLTEVKKMFTSKEASQIERPKSGSVGLLVGFSYAAFHPAKIEEVGHLLLMRNRFGDIIAGSHPTLKETTRKVVKHATVLHSKGSFEEFQSIESLGVACSPKCGGCRCGKCQTGGKNMTIVEEKEYELIKQGLSFNQATGKWRADYPYIVDPRYLPESNSFAYATLMSTEKRLAKNPLYSETYRSQIEDMLKRGVARKVSDKALHEYAGTKFYISHHDVMNPRSVSTPMRVVFNSSARTKGGMSLNDCLAKGPCLLNELLGILMRFRQEQFAFIGDISKMFHSIEIPVHDQMTHLFFWRDMQLNKNPETFAMTALNMGDKPASAIAQTALRMTAEEAAEEFPEASEMIMKNSYMDDIPASAESKVAGMKLMKDAETLLAKKNFRIKNWTFSGQKTAKDKSKDQMAVQTLLRQDISNELSKVLGMEWEEEEDVIRFNLNSLGEKETTKRSCLSTICRIYDPIGLLAPVTVSAKIILRKIWAHHPKVDWDDPLPTELQKEWSSFRESLFYVKSLKFNRSLKPANAESPLLIIFSDGSKDAYGAVAYVRWKTPNGFEARLIAGKSRIAPLRILDIVRLELCGAVLNARLYGFISHELDGINFEGVHHIIDSEIVKAMISRDSYGFRTFAANRIGEIQDITKKEDWYWVESKLNVADLATRPLVQATKLDTESTWQNGPEFLKLPVEEWPTRKDTHTKSLPEAKKDFVGSVTAKESMSLVSRIDVTRFSQLRRLLYTTARLQKLQKKFKKDAKEYQCSILPEDIRHAHDSWIKHVQRDLCVEVKAGKHQKLLPAMEDGILVVGGRAERWIQSTWNKQKFILLPGKHHFSKLIAEKEHVDVGHLALESTIARIRSKYWITGVRKLVREVIRKCRHCKVKFKKLASQKMSPLPIERLKPTPPFQNVGLDYFGPFEVKGEVQKRTRGKGYGLLLTCDSSRAVHAEIAQDFSTDAFLQALRRFGCMRGWPKKIHSDNGTQLVGATNEMSSVISGLSWNEVQEFGHKFGTTWSFCPPDAPWQNGSTEALVKSIKRALKCVMGNQVFSYAELQTVVYEAAQLVNQRPIGRHPTSPDEGAYLCPNDLLLGRSTPNVPQGPFAEKNSLKHRLQFIEEVVSSFWKRWSREVFPSLVLEPKWHTEKRNALPGDVVMIQDSNAVRGKWKLGVITRVLESKDGRVRNVEVKYKNNQTEVLVRRPVQRLIVVVPAEEGAVEVKETQAVH